MPELAFNYDTLVQTLEESVKRNLSDGLLLSGGLDTAIIACLAAKWRKPHGITVALRDAPAPDVECAKLVASRLGLKHHLHYFGKEELNEAIRAVVRVMKTFDPMEVRNSAAIYVALKTGRDLGMSTIMTGDGGDELFGGYSFLFGLNGEKLDSALKKMWTQMRFSSIYLGRELGLDVRLPFLAPEFKEFATKIDVSLKIRNEGGQVWGKWVLRKAFENIMPREIVWRVKAPVEVGSGTTVLPTIYEAKVSNDEFNQKKAQYLTQERVVIRSKEHLFYYEIYRGIFGLPGARASGAKTCPDCGSGVKEDASFCRTCGAYPI